MVMDPRMLKTTTQVVDYMIHRFMRVPPGEDARQKLIAFLNKELGTADISVAQTYLEDPLRSDPAPDHEPARVSVGLEERLHEEELIFRFRNPAGAICCASACTASE
jgi:hypothetical protein